MEELDQGQRTTKRRALDLSLVQVAASALAAVVGAVLASELGVYGTVIGAAVVSLGATVGGAVLQHFFRRTGEEFRSRVPAVAVPGQGTAEPGRQRAEDTAAFDPFDPGGEHTRMLAVIAPPEHESVATYRGRSALRRPGWRTCALLTGLVFVLAMGTVTVVELVANKPIAAIVRNEPGSGTSIGGGTAGKANQDPVRTPDPGASVSPGSRPSGGPTATPSPDPTGSPSTGPSVTPTPTTGPSGSATPAPPSSPLPSGGAGGAAEAAAGASAPPQP